MHALPLLLAGTLPLSTHVLGCRTGEGLSFRSMLLEAGATLLSFLLSMLLPAAFNVSRALLLGGLAHVPSELSRMASTPAAKGIQVWMQASLRTWV